MEDGGWPGFSIFHLQSSILAAIHRCLDFLQRGGLRRIQRQRLRRQNVLAGIRIALGNLRGDFDQTAVFEFADGGGGGFGQFDQFRQRQFAPFLDDVPDFLLAFGQFRKFAAHRQRADKQAFAPAGFFLAHGFGQNGFQRDFRRAAVIIGNPAREFQDLRRDERLRADDFENGFEIGVCRFLGERGDAAQNFSRAERHLHAAAHLDLPRQSGRNQIIELLAERDFEADAGNHSSGRELKSRMGQSESESIM